MVFAKVVGKPVRHFGHGDELGRERLEHLQLVPQILHLFAPFMHERNGRVRARQRLPASPSLVCFPHGLSDWRDIGLREVPS